MGRSPLEVTNRGARIVCENRVLDTLRSSGLQAFGYRRDVPDKSLTAVASGSNMGRRMGGPGHGTDAVGADGGAVLKCGDRTGRNANIQNDDLGRIHSDSCEVIWVALVPAQSE